MPPPATVGGDGDRRVDSGDGSPRVGGDERLVAESDDDRRGAEIAGGRDAGAERRHLPLGPPLVDHVDDLRGQRGGDLCRGHHDDGSDACGEGRPDGAIEDRPVVDHGVELVARALEAGAGAGGEDDGDDARPAVVVTGHDSILAASGMNDGLRNCDRPG